MGTSAFRSMSSVVVSSSVTMVISAWIIFNNSNIVVEARSTSSPPLTSPFIMKRYSRNVAFLPRIGERHGLFNMNDSWTNVPRGGGTTASGGSNTVEAPEAPGAAGTGEGKPMSLDEKVQAAMRKLGLVTPPSLDDDDGECENGVCPIPSDSTSSSTNDASLLVPSSSTEKSSPSLSPDAVTDDPTEMAIRIAKDMNVDGRLSMAALRATATMSDTSNRKTFNESAARAMIQQELDLIESIPTDSPNVQTLTNEGHSTFLSRRALAFAEDDLEDARAILVADLMDDDEDRRLREETAVVADDDGDADMDAESPTHARESPDFVEVKSNFDPTKLPTTGSADSSSTTAAGGGNTKPDNTMPKPAPKESVVFEATTAQLQELVLESPVPLLLDIYADWCGPCKVLGPALEDMAVKGGGMFRLVKVNSDNEGPVSQALGVTALPTVFAFRDGKIVHMFEGMPRSEDMMKNFMMGLFGAAPFSPPITAAQSAKYEELTSKFIKMAGSASFSFSSREILTDRITTRLDELVKDETVADVEGTASLIRKMLNNIIQSPYEEKFRRINLENKVIASKIGENPSTLAVLKSVGFGRSDKELILAKGKKVINVAPLVVARDCIDKWIQRNRAQMAAAARKRKDEIDHARLLAEKGDEVEGEEEEDEEEEELDQSLCTIKLRLDGKKKIQEVKLHQDSPLSNVLELLNIDPETNEKVQVTCVAKRLVVNSSDKEAMKKTLEQHGLMPSAAIVVKVGSSANAQTSNLKERAEGRKRKKKGSHTMHSIGLYAKDDNNKAELIDGGGGVWYEHDVSDDEESREKGEDEAIADEEEIRQNEEENASVDNDSFEAETLAGQISQEGIDESVEES